MNIQLSSFGYSVQEIAKKSKDLLLQSHQISGRHKTPHSVSDLLQEVPSFWDLTGRHLIPSLLLMSLSLSLSPSVSLSLLVIVWISSWDRFGQCQYLDLFG
jgi:hypothetical protein